MALKKDDHGVRVIAPKETGSEQTAQSVVLDTFTVIEGRKKTTYGLLFRVDTNEFLTAIAQSTPPKVLGEGEVPSTTWAVAMVDTNMWTAVNRFWNARMGMAKINADGMVTVTI